jgi:hypothetical protein
MIPLLKRQRHEIQVLLRAEHSRTDVARRTGVSVYTVRRAEPEQVPFRVSQVIAWSGVRDGAGFRLEQSRDRVRVTVAAPNAFLSSALIRYSQAASTCTMDSDSGR